MRELHSLNYSPTLKIWSPIVVLAAFLGALTGCQSAGRSRHSNRLQNTADCSDVIGGGQGRAAFGASHGSPEFIPEASPRQADFGPGAIPAPLGTYVHDWNDTIICSARNDQFVISRHEWFSGGGQLGPLGQQHLQQLAYHLPTCPEQVILEAEPVDLRGAESFEEARARTAALNSLRRQEIVSGLQLAGVYDAEMRVHIGSIDRVGVRGIEAPVIYNRLLQGGQRRNGQNQGGAGSQLGIGSGAGGGGMGGGGFF